MGGPVELQQLVHGYRRGHEMLAASVRLDPADADRATRLSDLSGLPIRDEQPSYLTCYPLPSGKYYALARTWPDLQAPRKGCVLTHTLLVPMAAWSGGIASATVLVRHELPARSSLQAWSRPLAPAWETGSEPVSTVATEKVREFSLRYFAQGRSPIIWIDDDARDGGELVPVLLDFLWPKLRAAFATCTHSLQPLLAGRRPFDLMFAPAAALPRFSKVPPENLVGRAGKRLPDASPDDMRVAGVVSRALHGGGGRSAEWTTLELTRSALPATPSALKKVALIDELRARAPVTPAAALAALDVLATLAPQPDEALEAKRIQFEQVVRVAEMAGPDGLELLSAVAHRCSRPEFRSLRPRRRALVDAMAILVERDPQPALALLSSAKSRRVDLLTAVGRGLGRAGPGALAHLGPFASRSQQAIGDLLRVSPKLPRLYLEAAVSRDDAVTSGREIQAWLSLLPPRSRAAVARGLFESPATGRAPELLADALGAALEADVPTVLDAQVSETTELDALTVVARFARDHGSAARGHLLSRGVANRASAIVLAEALPGDGSIPEVASLLAREDHSDCALDWFVEAFTRRGDVASADSSALRAAMPTWVARLLKRDCMAAADRAAAVSILLRSSGVEKLWETVQPEDEEGPVWTSMRQELGRALLPGLARGYLEGRLGAAAASRWAATATVRDTLRDGDGHAVMRQALDGLLVDACVAGRVWTMTAEMVAEGRDMPGLGSVPLLDLAFSATRDTWPSTAVRDWLRLLSLGRVRRREAGLLDVHAVRTCLAATDVPVSQVLTDAFPRVYAATVAGNSNPWLELLWLFADWDRGKELRARLIDGFAAASCWPAGDLALTASRTGILPKIVSRAAREGQHGLLRRAVEDLDARSGAEHAAVARRLRELLERQGVEAWD